MKSCVGLGSIFPLSIQQRPQIEASCKHEQTAVRVPWPLRLWPIPVQFDAVSVLVAQVQRFADPVVGRSIQLDSRCL